MIASADVRRLGRAATDILKGCGTDVMTDGQALRTARFGQFLIIGRGARIDGLRVSRDGVKQEHLFAMREVEDNWQFEAQAPAPTWFDDLMRLMQRVLGRRVEPVFGLISRPDIAAARGVDYAGQLLIPDVELDDDADEAVKAIVGELSRGFLSGQFTAAPGLQFGWREGEGESEQPDPDVVDRWMRRVAHLGFVAQRIGDQVRIEVEALAPPVERPRPN